MTKRRLTREACCQGANGARGGPWGKGSEKDGSYELKCIKESDASDMIRNFTGDGYEKLGSQDESTFNEWSALRARDHSEVRGCRRGGMEPQCLNTFCGRGMGGRNVPIRFNKLAP
jgi:hypothetical protein